MDLPTMIGVILVAVISITSHEAAHGFVADWLGDPTAREQGRLTLNPIPHIDLFFTILLPLFLILSGSAFIFGGAKPVPVHVSRLRSPRRDWALVGAAGPGMNIFLVLLLTIFLLIVTRLGLADRTTGLTEVLAVGIFLNALLTIFNLLPIPPLDGSRIFQYLLTGESLRLYRRLDQYGLIIILALLYFVPQFQALISVAIFGFVEVITLPFGVWVDIEPLLRGG
ncbi:MAG: site-2 protease family protein [Nitrospira sp.]|nr:site-2 protease family protein [Nitrospira sp.]MCA9499684.1 site-2 protease family protein [Nitrospira sp.]